MANTYTLIQSVTVGSGGAASIEFGSIPQTYTDLVLASSVRTDESATFSYSNISFNGNTSSYSSRWVYGTGAAAGSINLSTNRIMDINAASNTSSTFTNFSIYIPNYAGSTNKSFSIDSVHEQNGTTAYPELIAGLWSNTASISSIKLYLDSTYKFVQYTSASLYGIKNS
jgi:hypothetical protein